MIYGTNGSQGVMLGVGIITIYSKENYKIYRVSDNYIIHNTNYEFKKKHTHIEKLEIAKQIIDNVINSKIPKTRNLYLLRSHIRIADDPKYINQLEFIIDKHKRKQIYYNRSS